MENSLSLNRGFSIFWGIILSLGRIDETPVHRNEEMTSNKSNNNYFKYFLILCVVMTLAGLAYRANNVVLPAYLEYKAGFLWKFFQSFNYTNIEETKTMAATLLTSSIYLVAIFGQLAGGKMADKYDLRRFYLIFHGLTLPFLIFMGIFSEQLLVISAVIYIFFALGMQPIENSLVAKFTPHKWRSTGYGIKFILTFGVGSTAVYFIGWIKEAWGLNAVYFFSGGIVVLILLFIIFLILSSRERICKNIP
jgi:MFS family permease